MDDLHITRRHLPHWTMKGVLYFITFCTHKTTLSEHEQQIVLEHIKEGNGRYYRCHAAVVMPDHVHLLIEPFNEVSLSRMMLGIKGVSAHKINTERNVRGHIWQHESYDRIVRNEEEFFEKLNYMFENPVRKELTNDPWNYPGWYMNDGSTIPG